MRSAEPLAEPFEPRGPISLRELCTELIRALKPDEGIAYHEAMAQTLDRLDYEPERSILLGAMRLASEALMRAGEPGVRNVARYGWVRMTSAAAVEHAGERIRRARRQGRRAVTAAEVADPQELDWEQRQRRDHLIASGRRVAELEGRRAARSRPELPEPTNRST